MKNKKNLGIIGGLGPAASGYFYELITNLTKADCDQQHIEIMLYSRPDIPDRSSFIMGDSDVSPLPAILEVVKTLNSLRADYIAIPCVTAHYFIEKIRRYSETPVISIVEETVNYLRLNAIKSAGVLATDGTIHSRSFQTALKQSGINPILPNAQVQVEIMKVIKSVKAGQVSDSDYVTFSRIAEGLREKGAETVLLACTELPLLKPNSDFFTDCVKILAQSVITLCGGTVRQ
ncbi:MAG: amino acid racemase [Oscillospiraceae bacterium]|nr:amino acid racemase [Oscillospiraceae bacterium]